MFESNISGWDFVFRFLSITIIDLALSGDNALVIGMAAASLEKRQRMWAIGAGGALAILLRIVLTTIATFLMLIPFLSVVGGLVLFWVAWKLLRLNTASYGGESHAQKANNFKQAIILIVTADFMMSLDNVIAVAGTAHGHLLLLILGLLISMPLLMTTGGVVSLLIDKFKWVVYLGALVIMFAGTRMIFEDRIVEETFNIPNYIYLPISAAVAVLALAFIVWHNKRQARRLAPISEEKNPGSVASA